MVKRMQVDQRLLHWVDHVGSENLLTWLYWRSLAHAKVFVFVCVCFVKGSDLSAIAGECSQSCMEFFENQ